MPTLTSTVETEANLSALEQDLRNSSMTALLRQREMAVRLTSHTDVTARTAAYLLLEDLDQELLRRTVTVTSVGNHLSLVVNN